MSTGKVDYRVGSLIFKDSDQQEISKYNRGYFKVGGIIAKNEMLNKRPVSCTGLFG
jgi:hypothetical protein